LAVSARVLEQIRFLIIAVAMNIVKFRLKTLRFWLIYFVFGLGQLYNHGNITSGSDYAELYSPRINYMVYALSPLIQN